jgi:hypothetical protein
VTIQVAGKWMQRETDEVNTTPVSIAVTAEIPLRSGEIILSPWSYKISYFHYRKIYN